MISDRLHGVHDHVFDGFLWCRNYRLALARLDFAVYHQVGGRGRQVVGGSAGRVRGRAHAQEARLQQLLLPRVEALEIVHARTCQQIKSFRQKTKITTPRYKEDSRNTRAHTGLYLVCIRTIIEEMVSFVEKNQQLCSPLKSIPWENRFDWKNTFRSTKLPGFTGFYLVKVKFPRNLEVLF